MRALAEYVMRGRGSAIAVAAVATGSGFFAWLGGAVVALVVLSKGPAQGLMVLLWTLLPALVWLIMGDPGALSAVVGAALLAVVLWSTGSWAYSLVAAVVSGVLTGLLLLTVGAGFLEQTVNVLADFLANMQSQMPEGQADLSRLAPSATLIAGWLGFSNAFVVAMCLVLARWWQSMLYNPGGFRQEFHRLRLSPLLTVALLALGLLASGQGPDYRFWALIFAVPFLFAGFSLVHAVAAHKQLDSNWLGFFYVAWLVFDVVKAVLLLLVVVDSWFNIRARWFTSGHTVKRSGDDNDDNQMSG